MATNVFGTGASLLLVDEYLQLLDRLKKRMTFNEKTGEGSIVELWPDVEQVASKPPRYYHHRWDKYVHTDNNPDRFLRILDWRDRIKVVKWIGCSLDMTLNIDIVMSFVYSLIVYYDPNPIGVLSPDRLSDTIAKWKLLDDNERNTIIRYIDSRISQR